MVAAVAEAFDIQPRNRLAALCVGHVEQRAIGHSLLEQDRVADPEDDVARVAVAQHAGNEVGARFVQRGGQADASVEMVGCGFQILAPDGRDVTDILLLVFGHEAVPDVVDLLAAPVQAVGVRFEIVLHIL